MNFRFDLYSERASLANVMASGVNRLNSAKTCNGRHVHLVSSLRPRTATIGAALMCILWFSSAAISADQMCFVPRESSGSNASIFVDPKSKVCRAFQRELNANCAGDIPTVEFRPKLANSGLTEPAWESVALYSQDGMENSNAFALLEKLIWSRAVLGYSNNQEAAAKRDVERILGQVREAHAAKQTPRFDKVSLDLEGRGRSEIIYRLYSGLMHNPMSINEPNSSSKGEPNLFLERALSLTGNKEVAKISSHAAGNDATRPADVILFAGVPHFLTWSADTVLISASYLRPNRPMIPDEKSENRTYIIPKLRCMFNSRQTH